MKYKFLKILHFLAIIAAFGLTSSVNAGTTEFNEHESKGYRLDRFINYYMMDYRKGEEAHTLGLETLGVFELGILRSTTGFTWRWPIIPWRLRASREILTRCRVKPPASTTC